MIFLIVLMVVAIIIGGLFFLCFFIAKTNWFNDSHFSDPNDEIFLSFREFIDFYKLNPEEIIVIYDDIDTNPGKIRIRKKGGPGTHNGMKSVVSRLNSEDFPRVRVGIGMPEFKGDLVNYVIGNITDEDYEELKKGINKASEAVASIIKDGIDMAMNKYNK